MTTTICVIVTGIRSSRRWMRWNTPILVWQGVPATTLSNVQTEGPSVLGRPSIGVHTTWIYIHTEPFTLPRSPLGILEMFGSTD